MISLDEFLKALNSNEASASIYRRLLLSSDTWLFDEMFGALRFEKYDEFKLVFSEKLRINSSEICLVGSAKIGFSLSPHKEYKVFDSENSDIDIVIVNAKLFNKFWELLLHNFYSKNNFVPQEHLDNVFKKFVSIKPRNSARLTPAFEKLNNLFGEIQRDLFVRFTITNSVNFRIYESWEAVDMYHTNGIEELRKRQ